jgi:hypothetical protein
MTSADKSPGLTMSGNHEIDIPALLRWHLLCGNGRRRHVMLLAGGTTADATQQYGQKKKVVRREFNGFPEGVT